MNSKTILVVGGLGYLGSRISARLESQGHKVTLTFRHLSPQRDAWLAQHSFQAIAYDSARNSAIPTQGYFDFLINLAPDPKAVDASVALLRQGHAKHLIHFSSFHVYGKSEHSKLLQECEARALEAPNVTIIRPTNCVGAPAHSDLRVQSKLIFHDCCRQAMEDGKIKLSSTGAGYRDFLCLNDLLSALDLLISVAPEKPLPPLNVCSGETITVHALATLVQEVAQARFGKFVPIELGVTSDDFLAPFQVPNDPLRALGWVPKHRLSTEILENLEFWASVNPHAKG